MSLIKTTMPPYNLVQLNEMDELLYNDINSEQAYPQLFSNQDSLFSPDQIYGQAVAQQVKYKITRSQTNVADNRKQVRNKSSLQNCAVNEQQIFQQYLDSLDIQQFINAQNQINKNTRLSGSKNSRNSQSSLQCTFKPSILKKSNDMAVKMPPSFQRLTMQVRNEINGKKLPYKPANKQMQKQYSKQRIQRLSKPRILKTQPEQVVKYRKIQTQKKYTIPTSSGYLDVAARNQLWEQQKQIKIQKLRKEQQENNLRKQTSTFAPKLTQYRGEKLANISNFGKQGIANYFQRVNMAKSKVYSGKQNNISGRRDSISPYCSNNSKTPRKQAKNQNKKIGQKIKYDEAVKQLHKKLMSLNI